MWKVRTVIFTQYYSDCNGPYPRCLSDIPDVSGNIISNGNCNRYGVFFVHYNLCDCVYNDKRAEGYQVQYLKVLSVMIRAKMRPRGSARIISRADASHEAAIVKFIMPRL